MKLNKENYRAAKCRLIGLTYIESRMLKIGRRHVYKYNVVLYILLIYYFVGQARGRTHKDIIASIALNYIIKTCNITSKIFVRKCFNPRLHERVSQEYKIFSRLGLASSSFMVAG